MFHDDIGLVVKRITAPYLMFYHDPYCHEYKNYDDDDVNFVFINKLAHNSIVLNG